MSPSPERFPYLESVPAEKRDRLEARLRRESNDMVNKFAILVVRAKGLLEERAVTVDDMKYLLKNSSCHKLYKAVKWLILRLSELSQKCFHSH